MFASKSAIPSEGIRGEISAYFKAKSFGNGVNFVRPVPRAVNEDGAFNRTEASPQILHLLDLTAVDCVDGSGKIAVGNANNHAAFAYFLVDELDVDVRSS